MNSISEGGVQFRNFGYVTASISTNPTPKYVPSLNSYPFPNAHRKSARKMKVVLSYEYFKSLRSSCLKWLCKDASI